MSTGVLIAGTWLAADKASFINLTINVTSSEINPVNSSNKVAGKILKVIHLYNHITYPTYTTHVFCKS